jgi:hypothetical protein
MSAHFIVVELRGRGVELRVDGPDLVVRGADRLTGAEIERLRQLKSDIIECLRRESALSPTLAARIELPRTIPCPADEPPERFERYRAGAIRFAEEWAAEALRAGWTEDELFALAEPFANLSLQGAAWFIGDSTVAAVTADTITLRTERGATQRIYRKQCA